MAAPNIPEEVDRFLARYVDTVEQLEVLLLLQRAPNDSWTAEAVAASLYSNPSSAARRLASLARHGLIALTSEAPPAYRFGPPSDELVEVVRLVADTYRERRVAVVSAIASRPMDNVRAFSDAFRIRPPEEG
jgi:hypothetical protein